MRSFEKYQELKGYVNEAVNWLANKNNIDSQDKSYYSLCNIEFKAEYCGQAYAGANNYHASPKEFNDAVEEFIKADSERIFSEALKILKKKELEALIISENELKEALLAVTSAKETQEN